MATRSEHCANRAIESGAQSLRIGAQFHRPAPVRARRVRVNYWPALGVVLSFVAPAAALALALL